MIYFRMMCRIRNILFVQTDGVWYWEYFLTYWRTATISHQDMARIIVYKLKSESTLHKLIRKVKTQDKIDRIQFNNMKSSKFERLPGRLTRRASPAHTKIGTNQHALNQYAMVQNM